MSDPTVEEPSPNNPNEGMEDGSSQGTAPGTGDATEGGPAPTVPPADLTG